MSKFKVGDKVSVIFNKDLLDNLTMDFGSWLTKKSVKELETQFFKQMFEQCKFKIIYDYNDRNSDMLDIKPINKKFTFKIELTLNQDGASFESFELIKTSQLEFNKDLKELIND